MSQESTLLDFLINQKKIDKQETLRVATLFQYLSEFQEGELSETKEATLLSLNSTTPSLPLPTEERYLVLENLGEGGMGIVQRVQDSFLGREVALKRIKESEFQKISQKQKALLWRLKKEAELTAILEHPNIVPLYDMQQKENGEFYFTMRKVEGKTLKEILRQKREGLEDYDEHQILAIFLKVCDAVAYAHSKGVIHRDLKPDNIMVGQFGEVYVMDWGIAKKSSGTQNKSSIKALISDKANFLDEEEEQLTKIENIEKGLSLKEKQEQLFKTQGGLGTPGYMAPEQIKNAQEATAQADIFSLGIMLKECFTLTSPMEAFRMQLEEFRFTSNQNSKELGRLKPLPLDIQAIFEKATKKNKGHRYHTISELSQDLERYLKHNQVSVRDYSLLEILFKWGKRNKKNIAIVFCSILFSILCLSYFQWQKRQEQLQQHQEKLSYWIEALKNPMPGMKEQALLEINKMQEPEIFDRLKLHLREGTEYFLKNKNQTSNQIEYFILIAEMIGWLEKPESDIYLIQSLKKIAEKPEKGIKKVSDLQYMAALANSLGASGTMRAFNFLARIRKQMLKDGLFIQRTQIAFQRLIQKHKLATRIPKTADEFSQQATIFRELGHMKQAIISMNKAITLSPKASSYYELGTFYLFEEDWLKAKECFEKALSLDPKLLVVYQGLSIVLYKMGHLKEALHYSNELLAQSPRQNPDFFNNRSLLKLSLGDAKGALKECNQVIALAQNFPGIYHNRAAAKNALGDKIGAIEDYDEAIRLNPGFLISYINRGYLKHEQGLWDQAIKDYNYVIQQDSKSYQAYFNRGLSKEQKADLEGAHSDYTEAIRFTSSKKDRARIFFQRGRLEERTKKYAKALLDYQETIKLDSSYKSAYRQISKIKDLQKKPKEAIDALDKLLKRYPNDFQALSNRGNLKARIKDYESALQDLLSSLQLNSTDPMVYFNLGMIYIEQNKTEEAIKSFEKGLTLKKHKTGIDILCKLYFSKAIQLFREKKYGQTKEYLLRFEKLAPKNHPLRNKLEKALRQTEERMNDEKK